MDTIRFCPGCRKPLATDAPQGLCPECLLKAALDPASNAPSGATATPTRTEEPPSLEEVAKLFPLLEILEVLGQGGMGVVYKARQKQLDRFIALKIMLPQFSRDPAFVERFNREARALAKLNHPNIVAVYDFGQTTAPQTPDAIPHPPLCFFIMEFVDGANLRSVIQSGKLTSTEALAIVPKLCDALQFAHDEGVVHRDIKPANILVDRKGRVKIADFGLAKLAGTTDFSLTRSQQGMGTPQYMAPEQLENAKSVDHRADIYSLGVVFYEMLTGELPLGRFALPSQKVQIDVRLDEIVLKALEREPARRYQQASEVRTQVENVTSSLAATPAAPAPVPRQTEAKSSIEPRLSHLALWGAILASLGPVVLALSVLVKYCRRDFFWEFIAGSTLGSCAICAATTLGIIAIGQIKRSGGKLYGLPLAFADAVLFPLLLVWGLVAIPFGMAAAPILGERASPLELLILGSLPAMFVCFLIGRAVWRKVSPAVAERPGSTPPLVTPAPKGGKRSRWIVAGIVITAICVFGLVFNATMKGHNGGSAARAVMDRAPVTAPLKSEQPIFYTFAGITHFVRGPDGPQLLPSFAQELGLNALQGEAVNKIIPKYYAEFVALERQHTEFKKDTNGHVHITISPFMEETFQLAERMVAEIRGVIGQDIVHPRLPGNLMGFGLFRHCGQTTVTAELWKEAGIYFLEETHGQHGPYFYPDGTSTQSKLSRGSSNKDWKQAFPEEYWIYWTEK